MKELVKMQGNVRNAISQARTGAKFKLHSAPNAKRLRFSIQTLSARMHGFKNPQVMHMRSAGNHMRFVEKFTGKSPAKLEII